MQSIHIHLIMMQSSAFVVSSVLIFLVRDDFEQVFLFRDDLRVYSVANELLVDGFSECKKTFQTLTLKLNSIHFAW